MSEATIKPCSHEDPDNSGLCIKCGYILDIIGEDDRRDNERHPQHNSLIGVGRSDLTEIDSDGNICFTPNR